MEPNSFLMVVFAGILSGLIVLSFQGIYDCVKTFFKNKKTIKALHKEIELNFLYLHNECTYRIAWNKNLPENNRMQFENIPVYIKHYVLNAGVYDENRTLIETLKYSDKIHHFYSCLKGINGICPSPLIKEAYYAGKDLENDVKILKTFSKLNGEL